MKRLEAIEQAVEPRQLIGHISERTPSSLSDGSPSYLREPHDQLTELTETFKILPEEGSVRDLIDIFFMEVAFHYNVIYRDIFLQDYAEFLQHTANSDGLKRTDRGFLALLLTVLSAALQFAPLSSEYRRHTVLRSQFLAGAVRLIEAVHEQEDISISLVQAGLFVASCMKNEGDVRKAWLFIGTTIRLAQAIRLHIGDSSRPPQLQEIENRTWWKIYEFERMASFILGQPYTAQAIHCSAPLPQNISNSDLANGLLINKPLSEPSENTAAIFILQMSNVAAKYLDMSIAQKAVPLPALHEVDEDLTNLEKRLPKFLSLDDADQSFDNAHPYLSIQRHFIAIGMESIRATLYRPFLLSAALTPYQALSIYSSLKMITIERALMSLIPKHQQIVFMIPFFTFDPAVLLLLAEIRLPDRQDIASLRWHVQQAMQMLKDMEDISIIAAHGYEVLDCLRNYINDRSGDLTLQLPYTFETIYLKGGDSTRTLYRGDVDPKSINYYRWLSGTLSDAVDDFHLLFKS